MKCLVVTGGCGFIGSNFIRDQLKRYPEQSLVNIDKLTYAGNPENLSDIDEESAVRVQTGRHLRPGVRAGRAEVSQARRARQFCRRKPRRSQHSRFGPLYSDKRDRARRSCWTAAAKRRSRDFCKCRPTKFMAASGPKAFSPKRRRSRRTARTRPRKPPPTSWCEPIATRSAFRL